MTFLSWSEDLDVKVDFLNDQHKRLISLMNRLHSENTRPDASKEERLKALDDLLECTKLHFVDEEAHMAMTSYPGLITHTHMHTKLLARLGEHTKAFREGDDLIPQTVFSFLKDWLLSHIKGIDSKYAAHADQR